MIRFIDLRGQHTGSNFAFWDTVRDVFVSICTEQAWDNWQDFEEIAQGRVYELDRFRRLCPEWVFINNNT